MPILIFSLVANFVHHPLVFEETADQLLENLQNEAMSQAKWYLSSAVTSGDKIKNWIHFRVDPSPKFYQYKPYKT